MSVCLCDAHSSRASKPIRTQACPYPRRPHGLSTQRSNAFTWGRRATPPRSTCRSWTRARFDLRRQDSVQPLLIVQARAEVAKGTAAPGLAVPGRGGEGQGGSRLSYSFASSQLQAAACSHAGALGAAVIDGLELFCLAPRLALVVSVFFNERCRGNAKSSGEAVRTRFCTRGTAPLAPRCWLVLARCCCWPAHHRPYELFRRCGHSLRQRR